MEYVLQIIIIYMTKKRQDGRSEGFQDGIRTNLGKRRKVLAVGAGELVLSRECEDSCYFGT